ncbi:hypothetical protein CBS101457_001473 [Exobasidium rhododendri]|nr:hypothetical protein CBS101457_001473 [Exobasidium rhododendri]
MISEAVQGKSSSHSFFFDSPTLYSDEHDLLSFDHPYNLQHTLQPLTDENAFGIVADDAGDTWTDALVSADQQTSSTIWDLDTSKTPKSMPMNTTVQLSNSVELRQSRTRFVDDYIQEISAVGDHGQCNNCDIARSSPNLKSSSPLRTEQDEVHGDYLQDFHHYDERQYPERDHTTFTVNPREVLTIPSELQQSNGYDDADSHTRMLQPPRPFSFAIKTEDEEESHEKGQAIPHISRTPHDSWSYHSLPGNDVKKKKEGLADDSFDYDYVSDSDREYEEHFIIRSNLYNEAIWGSFHGVQPSVSCSTEGSRGHSFTSPVQHSMPSTQALIPLGFTSRWMDKRGEAQERVPDAKLEEVEEKRGERSVSKVGRVSRGGKHRNRNACTLCKKGKTGCSGGTPCERCKKVNGNCIYEPVRTRGLGLKNKKRKLLALLEEEKGADSKASLFGSIASYAPPVKQQKNRFKKAKTKA